MSRKRGTRLSQKNNNYSIDKKETGIYAVSKQKVIREEASHEAKEEGVMESNKSLVSKQSRNFYSKYLAKYKERKRIIEKKGLL